MIEDDAELDAEIRRLLAVHASPEFVARVRRRIEEEPRHGLHAVTPPTAWWIRTAATLAAIAAAIILWMRAPAHQSEPLTARAIAAPPIRLEPEQVTGLRHPRFARGPRRPRVRSASSDAATAEAEVLIDQREASAIRAFLDRLHDGRFDVTPVDAFQPASDFTFTNSIEIAPIEIDPLTAATALQGVQQ